MLLGACVCVTSVSDPRSADQCCACVTDVQHPRADAAEAGAHRATRGEQTQSHPLWVRGWLAAADAQGCVGVSAAGWRVDAVVHRYGQSASLFAAAGQLALRVAPCSPRVPGCATALALPGGELSGVGWRGGGNVLLLTLCIFVSLLPCALRAECRSVTASTTWRRAASPGPTSCRCAAPTPAPTCPPLRVSSLTPLQLAAPPASAPHTVIGTSPAVSS